MCYLWWMLFLPRHKELSFIYSCFPRVKVIASWMATHFVSLHFQGRELFSGPPHRVQSGNKPFVTCRSLTYILMICSNKVSSVYSEHMFIKNTWKMSLKTLYEIYSGLVTPNKKYSLWNQICCTLVQQFTFKKWIALLRFYFERPYDVLLYILTYQKN